MKCATPSVDDTIIMNASDANNPSADQSSTDLHAPNPTDAIAISATQLIKMIESGHGTDVNELVHRVLHDRQVA